MHRTISPHIFGRSKNFGKKFFFRFFQYYDHIFWLKSIFSDKITILSYKTIFGTVFSLISENLVEQFFCKFQKTVILGQNVHFLGRLAEIAKMWIFIKNQGVLFFNLIVPQLHAEFQKNRCSGSRDQFVRYIHPYIHTSIQRWNHRTGRSRWFHIHMESQIIWYDSTNRKLYDIIL